MTDTKLDSLATLAFVALLVCVLFTPAEFFIWTTGRSVLLGVGAAVLGAKVLLDVWRFYNFGRANVVSLVIWQLALIIVCAVAIIGVVRALM